MNDMKVSNAGELRIILCIEFDRRATPAEVLSLKSALRDSPNCIHSIEVTGGFDLIVEFAAPGISWYRNWFAGLADPFARIVNRYESNFVFGRAVKRMIDQDAVWVPESGGFKRIDNALIDKVEAEGDYVRIYSQGQSWMLHETMKSICQRLPSSDFIRIHRSTIVRFQFISRVVRNDGHWTAHLADGTRSPVARSHVFETLEVVRSHARSLAKGPIASTVAQNALPAQQ